MCEKKKAFLFPVERIENKCKYITSKCTHQWFKRNKGCEQKKFILFGDMLKTVKFITLLTLTLITYLTANTIFAPVHRPVFNTITF